MEQVIDSCGWPRTRDKFPNTTFPTSSFCSGNSSAAMLLEFKLREQSSLDWGSSLSLLFIKFLITDSGIEKKAQKQALMRAPSLPRLHFSPALLPYSYPSFSCFHQALHLVLFTSPSVRQWPLLGLESGPRGVLLPFLASYSLHPLPFASYCFSAPSLQMHISLSPPSALCASSHASSSFLTCVLVSSGPSCSSTEQLMTFSHKGHPLQALLPNPTVNA